MNRVKHLEKYVLTVSTDGTNNKHIIQTEWPYMVWRVYGVDIRDRDKVAEYDGRDGLTKVDGHGIYVSMLNNIMGTKVDEKVSAKVHREMLQYFVGHILPYNFRMFKDSIRAEDRTTLEMKRRKIIEDAAAVKDYFKDDGANG